MDEQTTSGVGVLDKAALVLGALEAGPATLAQLVSSTGLARPTAHRLAVALEYHRMVARDMQGRFILGPRLQELSSAAGEDRLLQASMPYFKHCAITPRNPPSSSAARATIGCVWRPPSARWACVTPFPWERPCR